MLLYLLKRQLLNAVSLALVLILMPFVVGLADADTIPVAIFWGGLFSGPLTWWDVRRRHQWPLYDNLRVHRVGVLALGVVVALLTSLTTRMFL